MKKTVIYWLRWFLVLPGALLIAILSTFPLHWLIYLVFSPNQEGDIGSIRFFIELLFKGINGKDIEYMLYPFVIALTFIFVSYKIAPKHKLKTAVVFFLVYTISWFCFNMILFTKYAEIYNFSIRTVLALVGAIIGLLEARALDKKSKIQMNTHN